MSVCVTLLQYNNYQYLTRFTQYMPIHNHFTALFSGAPGWGCARREPLDFMVQGKINRGGHTDHPAGRHSIRTNQCPPPPNPHFYRPEALPAAQPTAWKHWKACQYYRIFPIHSNIIKSIHNSHSPHTKIWQDSCINFYLVYVQTRWQLMAGYSLEQRRHQESHTWCKYFYFVGPHPDIQ